MAASLIEDARKLMQEESIAYLDNYRCLVEAIAEETPYRDTVAVTTEIIRDILADVRKSVDDLTADVELVKKRKVWALQVAAGEQAKARTAETYAAVRLAIDTRKRVLEEEQKKHDALVIAAECRHNDGQFEIRRAEEARTHLINTAPPLAAGRLHRLQKTDLPRLSQDMTRARNVLTTYLDRLADFQKAAGERRAGKNDDDVRQIVAQLERDIRDAEAALAKLEADHAALKAEADSLESMSLEPWHEGFTSLR